MSYEDEGYNAFQNGKGLAQNPYPIDSNAGDLWEIGWLDAAGYEENSDPYADIDTDIF